MPSGTLRKEKQIPVRESVELRIRAEISEFDTSLLPVISRLSYLSEVKFVKEKQEGAYSFMVNTTEYYIPLTGTIDIEGEKTRIKAELEYYRGFLSSVMKKLENERFVKNAPANVLDLERKKKADTESKINSLEELLKGL